jgi:uncharacterized GH25 family protein
MRMGMGIAMICFGGWVGSAEAHFNMLLPQSASAKKGEALTILYQWGHPFEHQLFDAPPPQRLLVLTPEGKRIELTDQLEKTTRKVGEKEVTAYRLHFTPEQRGDYLFVLRTPPIFLEEDGEFVQDTVKTVLHVQAQKGWDGDSGDFEFVPLTRPYGLRPNMVFQVEMPRRPAEGGTLSLVEIERYNAEPPKKLPSDEQITRTVRLDRNGVATTTLSESGWWCLTVSQRNGTRQRDGKSYPVRQRSTFWVFVDETASASSCQPAAPAREGSGKKMSRSGARRSRSMRLTRA